MPRNNTSRAQDDLIAEFQALVGDTEKLLQHTASLAGEQAEDLRLQIHDSLKRARETLNLAEERLVDKGKAAVAATEGYVQEHPWQTIGLAAGVGFLLGLLANRR